MKRKELTETFMMISNQKNPFGLHGLKYVSAVRYNEIQERLVQ